MGTSANGQLDQVARAPDEWFGFWLQQGHAVLDVRLTRVSTPASARRVRSRAEA